MPQSEALASIGYYADEDCPGPVIRALRDSGFDVVAQHEINGALRTMTCFGCRRCRGAS